MPNLSEISIVKTTDPASSNTPFGRTDGVFTVVLPAVPTENDNDLFTFESGDVHGAIKEVSGFKSETEVVEFSPDQAVTWTAIAMAESHGNTGSHAPYGEDSRGLWQINVDPAQTDNADTFDCSELVQWAGVATENLTITHEGWLI